MQILEAYGELEGVLCGDLSITRDTLCAADALHQLLQNSKLAAVTACGITISPVALENMAFQLLLYALEQPHLPHAKALANILFDKKLEKIMQQWIESYTHHCLGQDKSSYQNDITRLRHIQKQWSAVCKEHSDPSKTIDIINACIQHLTNNHTSQLPQISLSPSDYYQSLMQQNSTWHALKTLISGNDKDQAKSNYTNSHLHAHIQSEIISRCSDASMETLLSLQNELSYIAACTRKHCSETDQCSQLIRSCIFEDIQQCHLLIDARMQELIYAVQKEQPVNITPSAPPWSGESAKLNE